MNNAKLRGFNNKEKKRFLCPINKYLFEKVLSNCLLLGANIIEHL